MSEAFVRAGAALAMVAALVAATRHVGEPAAIDDRVDSAGQLPPASSAPEQDVDSLARVIVAVAPFRAVRQPPVDRYDPSTSAEGTAEGDAEPAPVPPRLVGIATGSPASAVLEGAAGQEGPRVVQVGDSIGGYTVRRISTEAVMLARDGVTVTLRLAEPQP